jgi:hypothetical protein
MVGAHILGFAPQSSRLASAAPRAESLTPRRTALTVYNDGSALIEDTRSLALTKGEQDVQWSGIPVTTDASSVHLSSAKDNLRLLQQSYRYDFAEAGRALELVRGRQVVCMTDQGKRFEGTLWAYDGGAITLAVTGGLVVLQLAHIASIETPLPERPLSTIPTLSWRLWAATGGEQDVTAAYLATGVNWHAEYVLAVEANDRAGRLSGAASIENMSGADFRDATVRLVAGSVHRIPEPRPPILFKSADRVEALQAAAGVPPSQTTEAAVDEYHLYTLTRRVTMPDKETRQVALFDDADVHPRRIYRYDVQRNPVSILTELALTNDARNGLGMPLPGGRVRVYGAAPDGGSVLLGEDRIGHVAKGDTLRVAVGVPFDLNVTRREVDTRRISDRETEQTWEATFRNRKSEDVTILWDEHLPGRDWRIIESSLPYVRKDAMTVEFTVRVPAGKEATVRYTVRWSY